MLRKSRSLSATFFPGHLYVFVVLMNGTKVFRGPCERGEQQFVRKNSRGEAEVDCARHEDDSERAEDGKSDGDLTSQTPSLLSLALLLQPLLNPSF